MHLASNRTIREQIILVEETLEQAVEKAIRKSSKENILTEFLQENGTEVLSMLFTEVTREEYGDIREQEGLERGITEGLERGLERGLTEGLERGIQAMIVDNLEERISKERIIEKLKMRFDLTQEKAEGYFCAFGK